MTSAIEAAAYVFATWRLFSLGLAPRQRGLVAFLCSRFLLGVCALLFYGTSLYFWVYVTAVPLLALLGIVAVREAISLVLDEYPGIQSLARWTLYGAVAFAVLSSAIISAAWWRPEVRSNLYYFEVGNRSVVYGLAVVVLILLLFLSYYPLNLSRNRFVSSIAFGLLFLVESVTLFIDSMALKLAMPFVDAVASVLSAVCLVVWGVLLQKEETRPPPRPPRPDDERLLRQLRTLDRVVEKATHR